jgi:hypothetical protein
MYSTLESEETCIYDVKIPPRGEVGASFEYTQMLDAYFEEWINA